MSKVKEIYNELYEITTKNEIYVPKEHHKQKLQELASYIANERDKGKVKAYLESAKETPCGYHLCSNKDGCPWTESIIKKVTDE